MCGNLTAAELGDLGVGPAVSVQGGPRSHEEFAVALSAAGLLLTPPGLTTLLEASAIGIPTLCLPPQNLSQVFNGQRFASAFGDECRVTWPSTALDLGRLAEVRLAGEEAALRFIDGSLAAQDPAAIHSSMYEQISQGIHAVIGPVRDWGILAERSGRGGAEQVAALLCQLVTLGEIPAGSMMYDNLGCPCVIHAAS